MKFIEFFAEILTNGLLYVGGGILALTLLLVLFAGGLAVFIGPLALFFDHGWHWSILLVPVLASGILMKYEDIFS